MAKTSDEAHEAIVELRRELGVVGRVLSEKNERIADLLEQNDALAGLIADLEAELNQCLDEAVKHIAMLEGADDDAKDGEPLPPIYDDPDTIAEFYAGGRRE